MTSRFNVATWSFQTSVKCDRKLCMGRVVAPRDILHHSQHYCVSYIYRPYHCFGKSSCLAPIKQNRFESRVEDDQFQLIGSFWCPNRFFLPCRDVLVKPNSSWSVRALLMHIEKDKCVSLKNYWHDLAYFIRSDKFGRGFSRGVSMNYWKCIWNISENYHIMKARSMSKLISFGPADF